jgi:alanine racemase
MSQSLPTTYVRVSRTALRRNVRAVKGALNARTALCAVVKANAYGHGLVPTAKLFAECGADMLGVASIDEGIALRRAGLESPVLVFHALAPEETEAAAEHHLAITLSHPESAKGLSSASGKHGGRAEYHLEVDVGLGRSGCRDDPEEFLRKAQEIVGHPPAGIWAHLGPGMVPEELPKTPPSRWEQATDVPSRLAYLAALRDRLRSGGRAPSFHVAASGALCDCPALQWDMVRIGSLLYGVHPSSVKRRPFELSAAIELHTRIVDVRLAPRGTLVGYGGEFRTSCDTYLATLPVGLYHGVGITPESTVSIATGVKRWLARWRGSRGGTFRPLLVRINEQQAPIVGRISLNECTVDLTNLVVPPVPGAEVVVPARMTTLNPTIPRVYIGEES